MNTLFKLACGVALLVSTAAPVLARDTHVQGYMRSDGSYVAPHYRSAPDSNPYNNWSSTPNVNPYTGQAGTRDPYGSTYQPLYTPQRTYSPYGR